MKRITVSLPDELIEFVEAQAKKRHTSESQVVREAVARYQNFIRGDEILTRRAKRAERRQGKPE